ncbi:MAG: diguanylate cyclase [Desulfuromonadaceae bacterium]|nr:diguanylate cyclase [Desulfuromonadaceae bacterium]
MVTAGIIAPTSVSYRCAYCFLMLLCIHFCPLAAAASDTLRLQLTQQHPEEQLQRISSQHTQRHSTEHLRIDARQMAPSLLASLAGPGYTSPGRWRYDAEANATPDLKKPGFTRAGFPSDPDHPGPQAKDPRGFYSGLAAALTLLIVTCLVAKLYPKLFQLPRGTITDHLHNKDALRPSEERFKAFYDISSGGIFIHDNGIIIDCNQRLSDLTGYAFEELVGMEVLVLISAEWHERVQQKIMHGFEQAYDVEGIRKNGSRYQLSLRGSSITYKGRTVKAAELQDITERKQAENALAELNRNLEALSITDGLTGIANRRQFDVILGREHARHKRSGAPLSLILLDIDFFKAFNDRYGHVKGDECLRLVAQAIAGCTVRPADLPARYGGEEFACILPETEHTGAKQIAEKIRRTIHSLAIPHTGSSVADVVTVSLGVVTVHCNEDESPIDVITQVDELLYRAKSNGRNRAESADRYDGLSASGTTEGHLVHLAWKDTFCCGNHHIDTQHQALFHTSNELLEATLSASTTAEISVIIYRLFADISTHFHDEEAILEAAGFPGLSHHREEHAALLSKGQALVQEFDAGSLTFGDVFQYLVHDVVVIHLLGKDLDFFSYVRTVAESQAEISS